MLQSSIENTQPEQHVNQQFSPRGQGNAKNLQLEEEPAIEQTDDKSVKFGCSCWKGT